MKTSEWRRALSLPQRRSVQEDLADRKLAAFNEVPSKGGDEILDHKSDCSTSHQLGEKPCEFRLPGNVRLIEDPL